MLRRSSSIATTAASSSSKTALSSATCRLFNSITNNTKNKNKNSQCDPVVVDRVYDRLVHEAFKGDRSKISTGDSTRLLHGQDASYHAPQLPDIVVFPDSIEEVQCIHRICHETHFPIVAFGVGSSLEGHVLCAHGGVSVDMGQRMNRVLEFNMDDMDITVQAGVTREDVNHYVRENGLFFPIDPGANATIGGMTATRASGTNAVRYGTMRDNVLRIKAVTADGKVIVTNRRAKKSSAGYDLTRLLIGSEGTLATICEITLRLYGVPESTSAAACAFDDVASAARTVTQLIQMGIPISRVELLDATAVRAVNLFSKLNYAEKPTLFFEFQGTEQSVREQAETVQMLASDNGGTGFQWSHEHEERAKLWKARHDAYFASLALRPGFKALTTDVCVPISRLDEAIAETKADFDSTGLTFTILGHVGDGNFHVIVLMDPDRPRDMELCKEANGRLIHRALALDGTCTGEHGVGMGKVPYMLYEHGPDNIRMQRTIKQALDPRNIMNPGKLFPTEEEIEAFERAGHKRE